MFGSDATKLKKLGPPQDFSAAMAQLFEATFDPCMQSHEIWKSRFVDAQTQLNKQVIDPIFAIALATPDPVQRNLLVGIAELSGVFHTQVTLLGEGLKRTAYEQGAKSVELWPKDQMQGVLALADRVIEMSKVMVQCNPPTTIQSELTLESPTIRRLQDCG